MSSFKTCVDCFYLKNKETTRSKIPYGYCKFLKMNLVAVQIECKYYKKEELKNGVA